MSEKESKTVILDGLGVSYISKADSPGQIRIATALERIAGALEEANEAARPQVVGATVPTTYGQNIVTARMEKGSMLVDVQVKLSSWEKARSFFDDLSAHLQQLVDQTEAQKGEEVHNG